MSDDLTVPGTFERTVTPTQIRIPADDTTPHQDKAQLEGRDVCIWSDMFQNASMKFKCIKVARNYGETQLLVEFIDLTRKWIPLDRISIVKVYARTNEA